MSTKTLTISRPIGPEDIQIGGYVAILNFVKELLSEPGLLASEFAQKHEVVRTQWLPCECAECNQVAPLKVVSVCLPFVTVKTVRGEIKMLDARRYQFAQLEESYGEEVFDLLKEQAKKGKATEAGA